MKKRRRRLKPTVLPFGFIDASCAIDDKLNLLSELSIGFADDNFILEVETIQELGNELSWYLRSRNALEVCIGRMPRYFDDEFADLVRTYRKKLKVNHGRG